MTGSEGEAKVVERFHVLSLLAQRERDVVQIRAKVKVLGAALDFDRLRKVQTATAASEAARLLLRMFGGGKMRLGLFLDAEGRVGMEMLFSGGRGCHVNGALAPACGCEPRELAQSSLIRGLRAVLDQVEMEGGGQAPLRLACRNYLVGLDWESTRARLLRIKRDLFSDTEESYLENLRTKHDEILRLLREKSDQNRVLDQVNNELLQLSDDLETLAKERTMIEMSLRIADQVRNPSVVIGGFAARLLKRLEPGSREAEQTQVIVDQAAQIEKHVQAFTEMAGRQRRLLGNADLGRLLDEALAGCSALSAKDLRVERIGDLKAVFLLANERLLRVAITHLLRHVAAQAEAGATLTAESGQQEGSPFVTIRFRRLDPPGHEADDRALALVRQILAEHRGALLITPPQAEGGEAELTMRFNLAWHENNG